MRKAKQRRKLNFRLQPRQCVARFLKISKCREMQVQVKTVLGESVYVTGSTVELGCWDHRNGIQLSTNPSAYPMWTGSHMIPSGI
jgi:hypothetical protein